MSSKLPQLTVVITAIMLLGFPEVVRQTPPVRQTDGVAQPEVRVERPLPHGERQQLVCVKVRGETAINVVLAARHDNMV